MNSNESPREREPQPRSLAASQHTRNNHIKPATQQIRRHDKKSIIFERARTNCEQSPRLNLLLRRLASRLREAELAQTAASIGSEIEANLLEQSNRPLALISTTQNHNKWRGICCAARGPQSNLFSSARWSARARRADRIESSRVAGSARSWGPPAQLAANGNRRQRVWRVRQTRAASISARLCRALCRAPPHS